MPYNRLSTSKIAKIVRCHPNTVRMYEAWGLLPRVPRAANGYRLYTQDHLYLMRLARTALKSLIQMKTFSTPPSKNKFLSPEISKQSK